MAETSLHRDRVAAWLRDQGHKARIHVHNDQHASVSFKSRGATYNVRVDESDPGYLYLSHGWSLPAGLREGFETAKLALDVERNLKVVKIALDWGNHGVEFNAEQFVPDGNFAPIFWRCVDVLAQAAHQFFARIGEVTADQAAHRFIEDVGRDLGLAS
jgi:hypothetical protein